MNGIRLWYQSGFNWGDLLFMIDWLWDIHLVGLFDDSQLRNDFLELWGDFGVCAAEGFDGDALDIVACSLEQRLWWGNIEVSSVVDNRA